MTVATATAAALRLAEAIADLTRSDPGANVDHFIAEYETLCTAVALLRSAVAS